MELNLITFFINQFFIESIKNLIFDKHISKLKNYVSGPTLQRHFEVL